MRKISSYFKGSYGMDKLSKYLLYLGGFLLIFKGSWLIGLFSIGFSLYRVTSKNKYKRYQELQSFEIALHNLKGKAYKLRHKFNSLREYKIFKCPNCAQKLRVPRNKGNITVTCKKCKTEFKERT
ncbi:Zn-finger containing protein [Clostridium cellulovorans]|uniref:Zn-finger containing protein n=1 Tax=Clostridium cellulovorans (strain ATCC 35296 / DSM 3052 / OCM 3 / 743B) TaxID=573061 RepID=D9SN30_CLOC7|nr:Zn-finger containing protein [Clostridium cellulovorans]ADL51896.1 Zn-finger containing protein [Clostridium cellulovorans 743B]